LCGTGGIAEGRNRNALGAVTIQANARLEDLHTASEEELEAEFRRQASTTVMSVSSLQGEFQQRATQKLIQATQELDSHARDLSAGSTRLTLATEQVLRSSRHLETLTKYLLVLTILLLLAALPPTIEALAHWLSR
jgi:hypothetical protein